MSWYDKLRDNVGVVAVTMWFLAFLSITYFAEVDRQRVANHQRERDEAAKDQLEKALAVSIKNQAFEAKKTREMYFQGWKEQGKRFLRDREDALLDREEVAGRNVRRLTRPGTTG